MRYAVQNQAKNISMTHKIKECCLVVLELCFSAGNEEILESVVETAVQSYFVFIHRLIDHL